MASADGSILIRTKVDTAGVKTGIKQIESGLSSIGSSVAKLGVAMAAVFSVQKLVQFGKQAIKTSSEMTNAMIGLKSIVDGTGNSFDQANKFIQDYISDGLVPATNAITAYKNLLMRGYTTEQIEKVMTALKDSAAFGRQASLDMGYAVQSATEGLRNENSILVDNAGVTKNVSIMWADYAKSIGVGVQSLTKEQRILAEVNGIMEETRFQTGDAAKVANTWSGQISMLNVKWQQFMVIVGSGLIKVLTPVVKVLNSILTSVISVGNAIAKVFGWETSIESTTASTASNVEDTAASQTDLGSSAKETNKALKKQLAFFDDINVLASEAASSGTGGTGAGNTGVSGGVIAGNVEEKTKEISEFEKRLKRIQDLFKEGFDLGFRTDKLDDLLENIKDIRKAMIEIWSDPELRKSMSGFTDSVVRTMGAIFGSILSVTTSLAYGITGGIKKAVSDPSFQKFVSKKISGVFDGLTQISDDVAELAVAFAELGKAFESDGFQEIISFFVKLRTYVDLTFLDTMVGLVGDLFSYFTAPIKGNGDKWGELLENIFTIIGNLLEPMEQFLDMIMGNSKSYDETSFHKIMQDVSELRSGNWGKALDGINGFLDKLVEITDRTNKTDYTKPFVDLNSWLNTKGDMIQQWYNTKAAPWFTQAKWAGIAQGMWNGIMQKWNEFVSWWNNSAIGSWFNNNVSPWFSSNTWYNLAYGIYEGIATRWYQFVSWWNNSAVGSWWNNSVAPWFSASRWQQLGENMRYGLYNGVKGVVANIVGVVNKIINVVEAMVNKVIDGMNVMIGKAIALADKVNLNLGINKIGHVDFTNISVPALAKGAVIPPNSKFMAILGDQKSGTNIEAPLDTIKQALAEVMASNGTYNGSGDLVIKIGESELVRTLLKPLLGEMNRQGYNVSVLN